MGYTAYEITPDSRAAVLRAFPPRYGKIAAGHVTAAFGVAADAALPPEGAALEIIGHAHDGRGIEALVVSVDGTIARPDGGIYHLTLSYDPSIRPGVWIDPYGRSLFYRPYHSNALIDKYGFVSVAPLPITGRPHFFLTRDEQVALAKAMRAPKGP